MESWLVPLRLGLGFMLRAEISNCIYSFKIYMFFTECIPANLSKSKSGALSQNRVHVHYQETEKLTKLRFGTLL